MSPRTRRQTATTSRTRMGRVTRRTSSPLAPSIQPLRRSARIAERELQNTIDNLSRSRSGQSSSNIRNRTQRNGNTSSANSSNLVRTLSLRSDMNSRRRTRNVALSNFQQSLNVERPYRTFTFNVNVDRFREFNEPDDGLDVIVVENRNRRANMRHNMFHFGNLVGMFFNNSYSSDSEDSFVAPRVINPEDISEDESDEEIQNIVELPPPEPPTPPQPVQSFQNRIVTRSMSRNPEFYNNQPGSSRRTVPYPSTSKNATSSNNFYTNGDTKIAGTKTVIKVDKLNPCTICCEEAPKRPVACTYCRQTIGCRHCVKKWFYTTNLSHLDQRTPYPIGSTDRNHKRCPLCRADWGDTMRIVTAVERDAFPALIQATKPPTAEESTTKS